MNFNAHIVFWILESISSSRMLGHMIIWNFTFWETVSPLYHNSFIFLITGLRIPGPLYSYQHLYFIFIITNAILESSKWYPTAILIYLSIMILLLFHLFKGHLHIKKNFLHSCTQLIMIIQFIIYSYHYLIPSLWFSESLSSPSLSNFTPSLFWKLTQLN